MRELRDGRAAYLDAQTALTRNYCLSSYPWVRPMRRQMASAVVSQQGRHGSGMSTLSSVEMLFPGFSSRGRPLVVLAALVLPQHHDLADDRLDGFALRAVCNCVLDDSLDY